MLSNRKKRNMPNQYRDVESGSEDEATHMERSVMTRTKANGNKVISKGGEKPSVEEEGPA